MNMKKLYPINLLGVGLLLCHTLTFAQNGKLEQIKPSGVQLKEVSNTLQVEMKLMVDGINLGKMEQMTVTPKLVGASGEHYDLSSFVIAGKMKQRYDSRSALLRKKQLPSYLSEYTYSERIPFAEWMENAKLVLDGRITGCGNSLSGSSARVIADKVMVEPKTPPASYVMKPFVNYVIPEAEPIKLRAETGSAKIEFMSGQSTILPTYKSNQSELDKINVAIRQVLGDSLAKVNSILLTAFASPEGAYASNERLSLARAAALKAYVESNNSLQGVTVDTKAVAEDWESLEKLITNSEIAQKQSLLKIIATNENPDHREQLMKALAKGAPWRTMLAGMFPQLRRTDYQLNYAVKDFTVEQGRHIIKTRPGQMSLNEMFHVANSYPEGSAEFNEVFDIAVRMFPDSPIANINAAATAIRQGNAAQALKYLERVKEDPQAVNDWAAYYMLVDDWAKAKEYLQKASKSIEAVKLNEKEIQTKEQNIALIEQFVQKHGKR